MRAQGWESDDLLFLFVCLFLFPFFMCVWMCMNACLRMCVGAHACRGLRLTLRFILEHSSTLFIEPGSLHQIHSSLIQIFLLVTLFLGSPHSIVLGEH